MNSPSVEVESKDQQPRRRKGVGPWLKRLGIAGFLFFLFKGLAWLFFGAAVMRYFGCRD